MTPNSRLASIIVLMLLLLSCSRPNDGMVRGNKAVSSVLDSVEYILDDDSHYADSLVRLIDPQSIKGKKQRARYALFYTAAQFKEYQPFTSDSLIMEAVRYYSDKRNIDYRFLSYYYLGCVYWELKKIYEASVALAQAELLIDKIDNDFWKGLLCFRLGTVYHQCCHYMLASEYYNKAVVYYDLSGKYYHKNYSLFYMAGCEENMLHYKEADSINHLVQDWALENDSISLLKKAVISRFTINLNWDEMDTASYLFDQYISHYDESNSQILCQLLAYYYDRKKDFSKAEDFLNRARNYFTSNEDTIYWHYYSYLHAKEKGDVEGTLKHLRIYTSLDEDYARRVLNDPFLGIQRDYYQKVAELESAKAYKRITILVASIVAFILIFAISIFLGLKRRRDYDNQIREYISTINELTTQISVNQDKISNLNTKVRDMIRSQFNPSDYLYTRYYEQIDDNKKAERVYRVVRNQVEGFTNRKNIDHIDELLNETFDGIMNKVLSSGIDIIEKDLLILRFVLAGFSSKSIAALLGDKHLNVNQRKKRLLDKIQIKDPILMKDLSIALNDK